MQIRILDNLDFSKYAIFLHIVVVIFKEKKLMKNGYERGQDSEHRYC